MAETKAAEANSAAERAGTAASPPASPPRPTAEPADQDSAAQHPADADYDSSAHTDDEFDFQDAADGTAPSPNGSETQIEPSKPGLEQDDATAGAAAAETLEPLQSSDGMVEEPEDLRTPMPTAREFSAQVRDSTASTQLMADSRRSADSSTTEDLSKTSDERSAGDGLGSSAPGASPSPSSSSSPPPSKTAQTSSGSNFVGKSFAALRSRFESAAVDRSSTHGPSVATFQRSSSRSNVAEPLAVETDSELPLSASTATIVDNRPSSALGPVSSADVKQHETSDLILDEESAKQSITELTERIPPSRGATSLLEPDETISNPFASEKESPRASTSYHDTDPKRFSAESIRNRSREPSAARDWSKDSDPAGAAPDTPSMNSNHFSVVSLSSTAASVANAGSLNAEVWGDGAGKRSTVMTATGDSQPGGEQMTGNYDFLLARLENQNARLTNDPKAIRNSMDGAEKLRENFEKLREQGQRHSRSESQNRPLNGTAVVAEAATGNASGLTAEAGADPAASHWDGPPVDDIEDEAIDWEFWGNVMSNYQQVARTQPRELSRAIQAGIPAALRGMMWQLMSSSKDEEMEIIYAYYLKQASSHEKAIRRDLNRTFPEQDYFQDGKGIGQENLFNVVKAYSLYDPEVGYCQGMQFVVGPLLLNMPDEEAFSTLVRLMKSYDLRGHFTPNMPSLQLRLFQFDRLLEEFLPLLHMHLVRQGVKSSMYASQWFMTLFSYRFPLELVYRILDSVFAEGVEALFRFALALMKKNEEALLKLSFDQAVAFLKQSLFEIYLKGEEAVPVDPPEGSAEPVQNGDDGGKGRPTKSQKVYKTNEFVRDAFQIKITPFMLDSYASEFDEQVRAANAHRREVEALRLVNRNLAARVKALEDQLNSVNKEHVDLVKSVVMAKIAKEEMAEELVKYKMMYAEAVLQADQESNQRGSLNLPLHSGNSVRSSR